MTQGLFGLPCPDLPMLSAYLDGKLDPADRNRIEDHVSRCDDCYFVVRETALVLAEAATDAARSRGTEGETPGGGQVVEGTFGEGGAKPAVPPVAEPAAVPQRPDPSSLVRYLLPIAATIIVTAGALAFWRQSQVNADPRAALVEAVGERRFFDARLTGGFKYGERVSPMRGGSAAGDWEVLAAAAKIRADAGDSADLDDVSASASSHLLLGDLDEAIRLLETAARRVESDAAGARLLSDLAAAYLTRAAEQGRADDYAKALDTAARAARIDPTLAEALFNKALALESLHLPAQAREAWDGLLAVEPDPAWRDEARRRRDSNNLPPPLSRHAPPQDLVPEAARGSADLDVEQLTRDLEAAIANADLPRSVAAVTSSVELARDYFEGTLLADQRHASVYLPQMQTLGEAFLRVSGDPTIKQTLAHLGASADMPRVREALALYSAGRGNYLGTDWSTAERQLRSAAEQLQRLESPMSGWANLYLAILELQSGSYAQAEARLDALVGEHRRSGQRGLLARAYYVRSILLAQRGEWDGALDDRTASEALYESMGDLAWAGFLAQQKGELLSRLGRRSLGWDGRLKALRSYPRFADLARRVLILLSVADDCRRAGQAHAAIEFLNEAQARAATVGLKDMLAAVEFGLMTAWAPIDAAEARRYYESAQGLVAQIPDPINRRRTLRHLQRIAGEVASIFGPEQKRALDDSIDAFSQEAPALAIGPLVQRAQLHATAQDFPAARSDLANALDRFEESRLTDSDLRWSAGARVAEALEEMAAVDVSMGREPIEVLHRLDERARTLAGQSLKSAPGALEAAIAMLPTTSAALAVLPLKGNLFIWWIRNGVVQFRQVPIDRDELRALCAEFEDEVVAGLPAGSPAASRLWALVLAPWARELSEVRRLTLVVHGPLAAVPFVYLAPAEGSTLLSRVEVDYARRVSDLPRGDVASIPTRLLAVLQRGSARDLPPLPAMAQEAQALSSAFESLEFLDAAPAQLLARLGAGPAFHFAGHALVNPELPSESSLVLSANPGDERYLRAKDISAANLSRLELVVLAACSTADGGGPFGEERLGLAHAFLAAGARSVLATLRPVSDAGTAKVVGLFYKALASSSGPAEALREVQLGSPHDTDASAFVLFSGLSHPQPITRQPSKES